MLALNGLFCYTNPMPSHKLLFLHKTAKWLTGLSALACAFTVAYIVGTAGSSLVMARLIRVQQKQIPWKSVKAMNIEQGVDAPADTHVVFQMPDGIADVDRETLFGRQGTKVRYWGYCLPQNEDEETISKRLGLPGLLFLSEAERVARAKAERERLAKIGFSLSDLPTPQQLEEAQLHQAAGDKPAIRHQLEFFSANMLCYIMTEKALPMGLDADGDALNAKLEASLGTDARNIDSDSDGIDDRTEFETGTSPTLRDTDSDGLIDGIEDANFNGRVDIGETDPRNPDTDRDDLCDGLCRVKIKRQQYFIGEDQNLNGTVDDGETSPLLEDTDEDTILDYEEYLSCLLSGKTQCP